MDVKELMIDDWVIFHDSGYATDGTIWKEDRICQIDGIDGTIRVKWTEEDGYKEDQAHVSITELSPIPLTKEILEKNGFVYHPSEKGLYGVEQASYYSCTDTFRLYDDGNPFAVWFEEEVPIHYIHQLQHLLRLIGYKKEIIL